jgi:serine/threonine protein kinase
MIPFEVGSAADPLLGQQVEGYRITGLIGTGGMGVVYEAVHSEIGQRAAIKVLLPEFSTDTEAVSRFVAEARAASKVRHGGLIQIFYSGRFGDETAYIMMELLDGESLEARMRRLSRAGERIPLAAVLRLGQQIASALAAVHRVGIVHRDLKPANIMLVADPEVDGGERIKVVDFGIAKFDKVTSEISKTTVGRFLGTALYASPEQCQMAGEVGPKADVYSLGVLLYEMLAGRPPFVAEQTGLVIGMHLFVAPPLLWEAVPSVPEPLHRLVHEMLSKPPDRRPTMEEVLSRLAAMKPEGPRLLWRLRRSPRVRVVAVGLMAGLLGTGTLLLGARQNRAASTSVLPPPLPLTAPLDLRAVSPAAAGPVLRQERVPPVAEPHPAAASVRSALTSPLDPGTPSVSRVSSGVVRRRPVAGTRLASTRTEGQPPAAVPQPSDSSPPAPASRAPDPAPSASRTAEPARDDDGILR